MENTDSLSAAALYSVEYAREKLAGKSVLALTGAGISTDSDGRYTIKATSDQVLVFSYIGYQTIEVAINGRTNINVTLEEDAAQLNEVVVTALGIKKDKKK